MLTRASGATNHASHITYVHHVQLCVCVCVCVTVCVCVYHALVVGLRLRLLVTANNEGARGTLRGLTGQLLLLLLLLPLLHVLQLPLQVRKYPTENSLGQNKRHTESWIPLQVQIYSDCSYTLYINFDNILCAYYFIIKTPI